MKNILRTYEKNKVLIVGAIVLGLSWVFLFSLTMATRNESGFLNNQVIRFHILAADDAEPSLNLKNQLRNFLHPIVGQYIQNANTVDQARELLIANMQYIQNASSAFVLDLGYSYNVSANLVQNLPFPTMSYGGIILPAGIYEALQIIIGDGEGSNWWCVMFPPMCILDAQVVDETPNANTTTRPRFWLFGLFSRT